MNTAIKGFKATGNWPPNPVIFSDSDFLPANTTDIEQAGLSIRNTTEEPPTTEKEQVGKPSSGSSVEKENPYTCSDRGEDVIISSPTVGVNGTPDIKVQFNTNDGATPVCSWITTDMNDSATKFIVSAESLIPIPKVRGSAKRTELKEGDDWSYN